MNQQQIELATKTIELLQVRFIVFLKKNRDIELRDLEENVKHRFRTWDEAYAFALSLENSE